MIPIDGVRHFVLEELVDQPFIERFGPRAAWFLDRSLVLCLDRLREAVGPITINNWHVGGVFHESGLRLPDTRTGAAFSQHKRGCAFDLKPKHIGIEQLFQHIQGKHYQYPQITAIENPAATKTWLHVDNRWHGGEHILIVNP